MTECFENVDSWQLLSYALTCTLVSRAPLQFIVLEFFLPLFVACELSCSAPYSFVSQHRIAWRFPVPLPLQVQDIMEDTGLNLFTQRGGP